MDYKELIKRAHQEAHECYSSAEVHTWIDWFEKELSKDKDIKRKGNPQLREAINTFSEMESTMRDDIEKQDDPNWHWNGDKWINRAKA